MKALRRFRCGVFVSFQALLGDSLGRGRTDDAKLVLVVDNLSLIPHPVAPSDSINQATYPLYSPLLGLVRAATAIDCEDRLHLTRLGHNPD